MVIIHQLYVPQINSEIILTILKNLNVVVESRPHFYKI